MTTGVLVTVGFLMLTGFLGFLITKEPAPPIKAPDKFLSNDIPSNVESKKEKEEVNFMEYYRGTMHSDGELWPRAQNEAKLQTFHTYTTKCNIKVVNENCQILVRAVRRFTKEMEKMSEILDTKRNRIKIYTNKGEMESLIINMTSPCELYPHSEMNENYVLSVTKNAKLTAKTVWGVIRGLESLTQLFYFDERLTEIRINATHVTDSPAYSHRGLLLDTARHYISVETIMRLLDAMSMNKMNVLHWHIVDDESFTYQSDKFPELSEKGSFDPVMVYPIEQISILVDYARDRGIRIYPEFDVPGHTQSWAVSHPEISVSCFSKQFPDKKFFLLNPVKKETYKLIWGLFREIENVFKDDYVHIGGDEAMISCWASTNEMKQYLERTHRTTNDLFIHFMRKVITLLDSKRTPVVWEEVFEEWPDLPNNAIVQLWKLGWVDQMAKILNANHQLVLSAPYDLNKPDVTFADMYYQVPRTMVQYVVSTDRLKNILGGEASIWSQLIDDRNIMSTVWPRAMAVAEALWSGADSNPDKEVILRAQEQIRRMNRRGIVTGDFY